MNLKRTIAACIATLSIISLAACGSGESAGVTDTKTDKGLPVLGNTVKYDQNHLVNGGKPITIDYWTWGDKSTDPVFSLIKDYEKTYPNVTIKVVNVTWDDYWTKLPLALKGKNGPALFSVHNSQDALLRPYLANYDIPVKDLDADYINVNTHERDGKVGYIDSVINTGNIYYNKKLWAQAGLGDKDIPKTWDQLVTVAKKLTKFNGSKMVQAGFNINGDSTYDALWQGLNYQKGELMFDKAGTHGNYDNKVTKENLQFLKDLYTKDKVGATNFGDDATQSFGNGQTAMVYRWGWMEGTLKDKYPNVSYGVFPTPTFSEATPFAYDRYNGESTTGINKNQTPDQQKTAQDFIKYMLANDAYQRYAVKALNSFPAKKNMQNDPEILANPVMAAIKPRIDRLIWPGPAPSTMETTPKQAFQNIFQNGMAIDKAVGAAQTQIDKDIKSGSFKSLESKYAFYNEAAKNQ